MSTTCRCAAFKPGVTLAVVSKMPHAAYAVLVMMLIGGDDAIAIVALVISFELGALLRRCYGDTGDAAHNRGSTDHAAY